MTNSEQDRWSRVKGRLRSSVGEDVYSSWFARMDLEGVQDESVHLSVPTRFLKSWIQAKLGRDERGANLVEYILLVALIALAVIAAVVFLRGQVNSQFNNAGSHLSNGS